MIYFLFLILSGLLQGMMISLNGQLGNYYSMFGISFFVHGIAAVLLILYLKCKEKKKIRFRGVPAYVYLVGFMISSAVVDHYGWFGIEKQKFNWKELPAYLLVLAGVWLVTTG